MNILGLEVEIEGQTDRPKETEASLAGQLNEYYGQVYGQEPETFEPGQIVWAKNPRAADFAPAGPFIFVEMLPDPLTAYQFATSPLELAQAGAGRVYDCVMLRICTCGCGTIHRFLSEARVLTKTRPTETTYRPHHNQ